MNYIRVIHEVSYVFYSHAVSVEQPRGSNCIMTSILSRYRGLNDLEDNLHLPSYH